MKKNRVAVIDVGTLKSKFEVREFDKNYNSTVLHKDKQLTVLGRDLDKTDGYIVEKSIIKTIEALNEFSKIMSDLDVATYKAVTTEAIRKANNSEEVLNRIEKATGIRLEELTQDEEAKILFKSISTDFPDQVIASADIGGGSVQVVIGKDDDVFEVHNFKTGVYFLQENFSETHHPTVYELENAKRYIKEELKSLSKSAYSPDKIIYGSTNIIDFMKAMNVELNHNSSASNHSYFVNVNGLIPVYDEIIKYSYEDRMSMFPEEPYYMWAADKALMNIFQISNYLNTTTIVPTNNNISTGILLNLAKSL